MAKKKKKKKGTSPTSDSTSESPPTSNDNPPTPTSTTNNINNNATNSTPNNPSTINTTTSTRQASQQRDSYPSVQELALLEKLRGNADFHKSNFESAVIRYTKAIALSGESTRGGGLGSPNPVFFVSLFCNRAVTHFFLKVIMR